MQPLGCVRFCPSVPPPVVGKPKLYSNLSPSVSVAEWSNFKGLEAQIMVGGKYLKVGELLFKFIEAGVISTKYVAPT